MLAKLPSQASTAYGIIKKQAGDAIVQVLTLTKTEMWSVRREKIAAVQKVASRFGASVNVLAGDWNHVFRPMPAHTAMSDEQKVMMARIAASNATTGVGMVLPPRAAMMEYALTRDAGEPAKIRLTLNENTRLTLTRTSVDVGADMLTWRGTVDDTGAPATIMWWPGVTMAATVRHQGRIYSMRRARGGVHAIAVVEVSEERMPPDHAPMPARLRATDPALRDDPLVQRGDASELKARISGLRPRARDGSGLLANAGQARPDAADDIVINVIVAYTRKAASHYGVFEHEPVKLAIEEANQSFRNSALGHVKLKLVHTYQTDYLEEGGHFDHLWRFADKGDGHMEEIHALREKHDADVAMLIVDDPEGCGLSTRVYAEANEAFAVVHHECAATSYSIAHEIGHLIGARHELQMDATMTPFPYGHGYVNGTKWRDIMSYKASCGGCRRLPVWSNPRITIDGEPAGTFDADNARVITEQAARVANFRASRDRRVYTSGIKPSVSDTHTGDQALTPR
jgi:hypothetical protein